MEISTKTGIAGKPTKNGHASCLKCIPKTARNKYKPKTATLQAGTQKKGRALRGKYVQYQLGLRLE